MAIEIKQTETSLTLKIDDKLILKYSEPKFLLKSNQKMTKIWPKPGENLKFLLKFGQKIVKILKFWLNYVKALRNTGRRTSPPVTKDNIWAGPTVTYS